MILCWYIQVFQFHIEHYSEMFRCSFSRLMNHCPSFLWLSKLLLGSVILLTSVMSLLVQLIWHVFYKSTHNWTMSGQNHAVAPGRVTIVVNVLYSYTIWQKTFLKKIVGNLSGLVSIKLKVITHTPLLWRSGLISDCLRFLFLNIFFSSMSF